MKKMTRKEAELKAKDLRNTAQRMQDAVSNDASMSSEEYISPERMTHYYTMANELRQEASQIEDNIINGKYKK